MKNFKLLLGSTYFLVGCSSYQTVDRFKLMGLNGDVKQLVHKKSGAKLVLIKNKDPARSFSVTFRTPPYDDTGLFHIFEHAVLAGSRLYPSKSNFFNVHGSSLASYINAFTASDHTSYPFTTLDPKDFDNLLSIYMDAVFFPKAIKEPNIIKREGWRYEVDSNTKKMSINGIVFSEMEGVFSRPLSHLWNHLKRSMLPDTPYAYVSGGLPERVPDLKFDQIVATHKKYYHPQNSLIFLYGDINFRKALTTIDKNFLKAFTKDDTFTPPEIPLQKNFDSYSAPSIVQTTYPSPKALSNTTFITKNFYLGELSATETEAVGVMLNAFAHNSTAPLKLKILTKKLAKDVYYTFFPGQDNAISFIFDGTDTAYLEEIDDVLTTEINKVIADGLDPKLLTSIINTFDFSFKEKKNQDHKGMQLASTVVSNWIHPKRSLAEDLDFGSHIKAVRTLINSKNYVKKAFQKHFKDNNRFRWLVMEPNPGFSEKYNNTLATKIKKALEIKPLSEYEKEDKLYREWASAKEPLEIINKVPILHPNDIKPDKKPIPYNRSQAGNYEIIEYPQSTNGISYITLFFDLKGVAEKHLKNLSLFSSFINEMNTSNYSFEELHKQINTYIGSIYFGTNSYHSIKKPLDFKPLMKVQMSFLNENKEKSVSLLEELLMNSQFSPQNRLQQLLAITKAGIKNSISSSKVASRTASAASKKPFFPNLLSFLNEYGGVVFTEYILKSPIDLKQLSQNLKLMLSDIFNQERVHLITITSEEKELTHLKETLKNLVKKLPSKKEEKDHKWAFSHQKHYFAYAIPGEVQYTAETLSFKDQGLKYHGSLLVYQQYLNTHFMIPQLREQGGAYGGGARISRDGLWTMSTYRDPHLKRSFDTFSQFVDFMKKENIDQKKLNSSIIGSLKSFYRDYSILDQTNSMTTFYLEDLSWEEYIQTKKEILETTPESFKKINESLALALKKSQKAVVGKQDKIKKETPFFKEILSFF